MIVAAAILAGCLLVMLAVGLARISKAADRQAVYDWKRERDFCTFGGLGEPHGKERVPASVRRRYREINNHDGHVRW